MRLKRPGWRKTTWLILIFNVLMLAWLVAGVGGAASSSNCSAITDELERSGCEAGTAIGTGIGAGLVIFLWVAGEIILGILWLVTNRKKTRECPACGRDVKKGLTACPSCSHDFVRAARTLPSEA